MQSEMSDASLFFLYTATTIWAASKQIFNSRRETGWGKRFAARVGHNFESANLGGGEETLRRCEQQND